MLFKARFTFLTILLLISGMPAFATHWLTYYVYTEQEYLQGPWIRAEQLGASHYKYLSAEAFQELFGSEPSQLANQLMARLEAQKPEVYKWSHELTVRNDTVFVATNEPIPELETVQNEVTATLLFNGFKAVTFQQKGQAARSLTLADLTLPYFDIVAAAPASRPQPKEAAVTPDTTINVSSIKTDTSTLWNNWLLLSLLLNLVLAGLLIGLLIKKKRNG